MHALLEGGAQVNLQSKNGWTALMFATRTAWRPKCVELLLKNKADVDLQDENGKSSLMIAVEKNTTLGENEAVEWNTHQEVAEMLLSYGAQVNLQDRMGRSAIMRLYLGNTVHDRSEDLLLRLLHYGADLNLLDKEGKSALMLACQNNAIHDVSTLLSRGAQVLQDKKGCSALMHVAASVNTETLQKMKQLHGGKKGRCELDKH